MNLTDCNRQWSSRPDDERFESLLKLQEHVRAQRDASRGLVVSSRAVEVQPAQDDAVRGLVVQGLTRATSGLPVPLTNWSFGQMAQRAGAPAAYLATLPAPMAADCLNYGLMSRDADDLGALVREVRVDGSVGLEQLAAVTGPGYGRVWNSDIVDAMVARFGDGVTGDWHVPGMFGRRLAAVSKADTTIYASDRDLWVFLADEEHRVEVPGAGREARTLARGFFVWNSEVGSKTFGVKTFLFDYVCCNRIVWGAQDVQAFSVRHTASAPDKWLDTVRPALEAYARSGTSGILGAVQAARSARLASGEHSDEHRRATVEAFLARRFTRGQAKAIMAQHLAEEGRPVETAWDAVVGATAYARSIPHQDARVAVETAAGALMVSP